MKKVRIGLASAWARDRFTNAPLMVRNDNLDYLCFESMSEITMSATQVKNATSAQTIEYDPYLERRIRPIIKECTEKNIKIITNLGWVNPVAAAEKVIEIAKSEGVKKFKVAAVYNARDVLRDIAELNIEFSTPDVKLSNFKEKIVSVEV